MFKCPTLYCLPIHKICNGAKDCPHGEDELMCDLPLSCPGMFRCKAGFCLDSHYVCDGIRQCPHNDDEIFCDVSDCPNGCKCIGAYFDCEGKGLTTLPGRNLNIFIGNSNGITVTVNELYKNPKLIILALRSNYMTKLHSNFYVISYLYILDLGDNSITHVHPETFKGLPYLYILNLDSNPIMWIALSSFVEMKSLVNLNLSTISTSSIPFESLLKNSPHLERLDIRNNHMDLLSLVRSTAVKESMTYIASDVWQFCCIARTVSYCETSSITQLTTDCHSLISFSVLKGVLFLFGVSSVGLNLFVFAYHGILLRNQKSPKHVILMSLAMSDVLSGLYMVSVGVADHLMQGAYAKHQTEWRKSVLCFILGSVQVYGMESSLSNLILFSAVQTFGVLYSRIPPLKPILIATISGHILFILVSIIPWFSRNMLDLDICVFHPSTLDDISLAIYSIFLHFVLNGVILILAFIFYVRMLNRIISIKQGITKFGKSTASKRNNQTTFIFLTLQTLCIAMCSCPVQIMMAFNLGGFRISSEIIAWSMTMLTTLNSIVDAVLYTLRTITRVKKINQKSFKKEVRH